MNKQQIRPIPGKLTGQQTKANRRTPEVSVLRQTPSARVCVGLCNYGPGGYVAGRAQPSSRVRRKTSPCGALWILVPRALPSSGRGIFLEYLHPHPSLSSPPWYRGDVGAVGGAVALLPLPLQCNPSAFKPREPCAMA